MEFVFLPRDLKKFAPAEGQWPFKECPQCTHPIVDQERYQVKMAGDKSRYVRTKARFIICKPCNDKYMEEVRMKRVYLRVPYNDIHFAKHHGAIWDNKLRLWYFNPEPVQAWPCTAMGEAGCPSKVDQDTLTAKYMVVELKDASYDYMPVESFPKY